MQITRRDKYWLAVVFFFMAAVTTAPMVYAHIQQGADRVYVPRWPLTATDTSAYYSDIEQVRQGRFLVSNQFTSESQTPSLLQPVWVVTGWMARISGMSTPVAYQVARLLAMGVFIVVLFKVILSFVPTKAQAWWAMAFVLTSSGLGALFPHGAVLQANDKLPYDLWVSESNTFLSLGHSALFIVSQLLIGAYFWQLWKMTTTKSAVRWWVGPSLLLLALVHPYDLITLASVSLVWLFSASFGLRSTHEWKTNFIQTARWWSWVIPAGFYYAFFVFKQPAMYGWLIQNISPVNGPWPLLAGIGLLLPLAILGGIIQRKRLDQAPMFLSVWAATAIIVSLVPGFPFQRRFLNGIHLPLALLAAMGIFWLGSKIRSTTTRWILSIVVLPIFLLSNVFLMTGFFEVIKAGQAPYFPVYTSRESYLAMRWLRDHSTPDQVIWTDFWNGNTLSGLMGRTVALGHGNQTVNTKGRLDDWKRFISDTMSIQERTDMLRRLRVTWLFWTNDITQPGFYNPAVDNRWQKVFSDSDTTVFKLQTNLAKR